MHICCRIFLATILILALQGCGPGNPLATIHYTEVGACNKAKLYGQEFNALQNQAIVVFSVRSIDNTQVSATWTLEPKYFTVNPPSAMVHFPPNGPPNPILGSTVITIPANQNVALSEPQRLVGIFVSTTNVDGSDAATTNWFLSYLPQGSSGPGTILDKANSGTSFPWCR